MGCSTYLGMGWRYQPLAPGHPTSICDIGVNGCFLLLKWGLHGALLVEVCQINFGVKRL